MARCIRDDHEMKKIDVKYLLGNTENTERRERSKYCEKNTSSTVSKDWNMSRTADTLGFTTLSDGHKFSASSCIQHLVEELHHFFLPPSAAPGSPKYDSIADDNIWRVTALRN